MEKPLWHFRQDVIDLDDAIVVKADFDSDSTEKKLLKQGLKGRVCIIDVDGDAVIDFDGVETLACLIECATLICFFWGRQPPLRVLGIPLLGEKKVVNFPFHVV